MRVASREQVYNALDGERDYQDSKWNEDTTLSGGRHSPAEWLVYMQDYLTQAMHQASRYADPVSRDMVLRTIRKITAMGVACMEQNGALSRETDQQ
jgi:hypothetical protein